MSSMTEELIFKFYFIFINFNLNIYHSMWPVAAILNIVMLVVKDNDF